ncbi:alpha/beta fold hydrolase [Embleya hyalina]|uniref:Alpha/beta hydrolase n=1 Tax=Embleya hyalina TaxID=516124 RepID=A0A401Z4P6_9ACTN|nr:alpha/beta hydrolase [Embleya hyalina]GCE01817.1 alpha/beta hydrolase [Embleya hyalina]
MSAEYARPGHTPAPLPTPPCRESTVDTGRGGTLLIREWGPRSAPAVIHHHGTPSSSAAVPGGWHGPDRARVRVVTFDRPGWARSHDQPGRTVGDAARWTEQVADACGIGRFAVMGVSGGGPHALAAAALLGDRVGALCVSVGLGPVEADGFDTTEGMCAETVEEITAARLGEVPLRRFVEAAAGGDVPMDAWLAQLPASDREILTREAVRAEEAVEEREWVDGGLNGWVEDDLALFGRPWGFDPSAVTTPTLLVYGGADVLVPASHGAAYLTLLPHAELRVHPDAGHWMTDHDQDALSWLTRHLA